MQRMNLAKNDIVSLAKSRRPLALSLDYTNKRLYWVSGSIFFELWGDVFTGLDIISSGYDGKNPTTVKSGSFNYVLLGLFEDSVYFQPENVFYINEMNITSRIISRGIKVDRTDYRDLAIVHSSLQPMGELQKS